MFASALFWPERTASRARRGELEDSSVLVLAVVLVDAPRQCGLVWATGDMATVGELLTALFPFVLDADSKRGRAKGYEIDGAR